MDESEDEATSEEIELVEVRARLLPKHHHHHNVAFFWQMIGQSRFYTWSHHYFQLAYMKAISGSGVLKKFCIFLQPSTKGKTEFEKI